MADNRLSPAARVLRGQRILPDAEAAVPVQRLRPPEPATIALTELAALIAERQRQEAEGTWSAGQDPMIVWLEIGHDESVPQALGLKDMALAYEIYAGWRQLQAPASRGAQR